MDWARRSYAVRRQRAVWVSCRTNLFRVSPEHLRQATPEEAVSQDVVLREFEEQAVNTQIPGTQTGFYDISSQGGTPFGGHMGNRSRATSGVEPEPEVVGTPTPNPSSPSSTAMPTPQTLPQAMSPHDQPRPGRCSRHSSSRLE